MLNLFFSSTHPKLVGDVHHNIANILGCVYGLYGVFSRYAGCKYGRIFNAKPRLLVDSQLVVWKYMSPLGLSFSICIYDKITLFVVSLGNKSKDYYPMEI